MHIQLPPTFSGSRFFILSLGKSFESSLYNLYKLLIVNLTNKADLKNISIRIFYNL